MNRPARCLLAFFFTLIMFIGCEENEHNGFIQDNQKDTITGILTNYTGCKYFKFTGISDTLSCINYQYNESQHQLSLKHINAGFNCCPDSLYAFITIIKDTVIIKEHER